MDRHGVRLLLQDRDGNWWEIQHEPRGIGDFSAGDKFDYDDDGRGDRRLARVN